MAIKPKAGLVLLKKKTAMEIFVEGKADPVQFARYFLDRDPHPGQAAWLRRSGDPHAIDAVAKPNAIESVLSTGNRFGKTDAIAIEHLWRAFYQIRPDKYKGRPYCSVNVSLSLNQAMLGWNYAVAFASSAPRFKQFVQDVQGTPFPRLTIGNGSPGTSKIESEIWARSTAKGARFLLGSNFNYLSWDEAAFQPDGAEILEGVVRMRLVDQDGTLALISCPNNTNWFYQEFAMGLPQVMEDGRVIHNWDHYCQRGVTFDNPEPNISHEAVRHQMQRMSPEQIKQNIYGEFAESSNIFDSVSVQNAYRDMDYMHLMGRDGMEPNSDWSPSDIEKVGYGLNRHRDKLLRYVMGVDLARKRDQTCIVVLRVPEFPTQPAQVVYFQLLPKSSWQTQYEKIKAVHLRYNLAPVLVDSTGVGDVVLEAIQKEPYCVDASGYNFAGGREKENIVLNLQQALQSGRIQFPFIRELVDQLIYYSWDDKNLQTDAVFGLALAWQHALDHGMDDSRTSYSLYAPDVAPASISRTLSGQVTINLSSCTICSHPLRIEIDEYLQNQHVSIDGKIATDVKRLIEILAEKHPDIVVTTDDLRLHKLHSEPDEDDPFEQQWKHKFSHLLI